MAPGASNLFDLPYGPFLIFGLRIVDVSLDTLRVLLAVRGRGGVAGILGFFQALIWIVAVGNAIAHLDSWLHILGYAAGFGTGTLVGISIEHALAYGLSTVRIVSQHGGVEIAQALRDRGYGVTEMTGFGRDGKVEIVNSVVQRQHLEEIMTIVDQWDPDAFVTAEEPKILRGGSVVGRRKMNVPWISERIGRQRV
ncbi:MAG TPA: DUF5698 domain-containing protein [Gemmatimonadaceae bacterium]|nr:DUF5698 domain-containing protein [Gemmatimonadaceae bacterium]